MLVCDYGSRDDISSNGYERAAVELSKSLDSSLKRHTALIRRMKLSIGVENRDQILKDVIGLSLEKYVDELAGAAVEGVGRCKTEKDVWSATEVSHN
jgi:regulator of nonsense transcripts 2